MALGMFILKEPKRNKPEVVEVPMLTLTQESTTPLVVEKNVQESLIQKSDAKLISLKAKVLILYRNPCFFYLTIASFFRFFGGYTLGFLSATFFIHRYPENTIQYAYMSSVIVIGGGLPASFLGGYLSDTLEHRIPNIKGEIAGYGALLACPFIIITFIVQPPFWYSVGSYYIAFFLAEMWYGPAHAQINNLFPSEFQGFACAVFNIAGLISGTIATTLLSRLLQIYDPNDTVPENAGYILAGGVLFSYVFCGPFFILSGQEYKKEILLQRKIN